MSYFAPIAPTLERKRRVGQPNLPAPVLLAIEAEPRLPGSETIPGPISAPRLPEPSAPIDAELKSAAGAYGADSYPITPSLIKRAAVSPAPIAPPPTTESVPITAPLPVTGGAVPAPLAPLNRVDRAIVSTPPPPPGQARKGVGGFFKDLLETGLRTGFNPLALGYQAMDRNALARYKDTTIAQPEWLQRRQIALGEAEAGDESERRALLNAQAQASIANMEADNARATENQRRLGEQHASDLAFKREQVQAIKAAREAQTEQQKQTALDRLIDTYGQYGKPVPPDIVRGTPYEGLGGQARPIRDPNALTPSQQHAADEAERARIEKEEAAVEADFKTAKTSAIEADRRIASARRRLAAIQAKAGRVDAQGNPLAYQTDIEAAEEELRQAQADSTAMWQEASGYAESLRDNYGREAGVGRGGYPFVKPKNRRGRAGGKTAGGGAASTRLEFEAADVPAFAKEYFNGDEAKARDYLSQKGYTIR